MIARPMPDRTMPWTAPLSKRPEHVVGPDACAEEPLVDQQLAHVGRGLPDQRVVAEVVGRRHLADRVVGGHEDHEGVVADHGALEPVGLLGIDGEGEVELVGTDAIDQRRLVVGLEQADVDLR